MKRPVKEEKRRQSILKDRFFYVNSDYKTVRIKFDDILYITGQKDYVAFHLENNKLITCLMNMKRLEDLLPQPEFLRVHRSHIVHMTKVDFIDRARFKFGDELISVSETAKIPVQDFVEEHMLQ